MPDEDLKEVGLSAKEEMESAMKGMLNHIHREIDERVIGLLRC